MAKTEKQLNFLLPINNARIQGAELRISKGATVPYGANSEKRYVQIKESLKSKGLMKSR